MDFSVKLIFLFLFSFPGVAFSSAALSVDFKASSFHQLLKTDSGILASVKYAGKNNAGKAVYGLRTASLSKSVIGNVLRSRAFSPWGIAVTAAVTAAGYYIDSTDGSISIPGVPGIRSTYPGRCYITFGSDINQYDVTLGACDTLFESHASYADWYGEHVADASGINICYPYKTGSTLMGCWYPNYQINPVDIPTYLPDTTIDVSDSDLYDIVIPDFDINEIKYELTDPLTGNPYTELLPLADSGFDLTNDYDAANDADPLTVPSTDSVYDTGDDTITDDPYSLPDDEFVPDEVNQCDLNPDSVGCLDVGSELASVDIPIENVAFDFSPVSLSSNAVCPAPTIMALSSGSITLSNQPICDFLTGVSPVLIMICSLLSVYIVVGGVKNG